MHRRKEESDHDDFFFLAQTGRYNWDGFRTCPLKTLRLQHKRSFWLENGERLFEAFDLQGTLPKASYILLQVGFLAIYLLKV